MAPPSTSNGASCTLEIIERKHIFLPSPVAITTQHAHSLPLTFLDIPWLEFPPLQPLFFFQLPPQNKVHNSYDEFNSAILPTLKKSLSFALQQFYPFAGEINVTHHSNPAFSTKDQSLDSVELTVATSESDFSELCSYDNPKPSYLYHKLVPSLPTISSDISPNSKPGNLSAIQVTFFPGSSPGFSIGFALHPVLCDQRTFSNFLYSWASYSKFGHDVGDSHNVAAFDRSVILDSVGLKPILFKQWLGLKPNKMNPHFDASARGLVRSTFVMGPNDIDNAKRMIVAQCDQLNRPYPVLLSPYVVTCAFVWTCFLRAQVQNNGLTQAETEGPMYFGFIAGGMTRLPYQVPSEYFGNCVGFGRAVAQREELLRQDVGILAAADAIGLTIKKLNGDILEGAENWISDWEALIGSEAHIHVVGSPKVGLYEMDFGWGRPKKIEEISIDGSKGISLTQSRDMKGGIEIGLTRPNYIMSGFSTLFTQGLRGFAL